MNSQNEDKNKDNNVTKSQMNLNSIPMNKKLISENITFKPENKNVSKSENTRYDKKINGGTSSYNNQIPNGIISHKNTQPFSNNRYKNDHIPQPLKNKPKENLSRNYNNEYNISNDVSDSNIKSIFNPFDSVNSNILPQKQLQGSYNNQINNIIFSKQKLSQRSNDTNMKNSHCSGNNYSSFTNGISQETKFEIINNDDINCNINYDGISYNSMSSNFFNNNNCAANNNKETIHEIKESDEEDYCDTKTEFLSCIKLKDLESYVQKFKNKNKNNIKKSIYEFNFRLSNIINNSPFNNINIPINIKKEAEINNLLTISNIVNIKMLNNKQITEKFNKDFYGQILSAKNFANLNVKLHDETCSDSSSISISQLHNYNNNYINNNKLLINKKVRDVTSNDGNSFIKAFIFNYFENIILKLKNDSLIFIIYTISTKLPLFKDENNNSLNLNIQEILNILKIIFSHIENKNTSEAYIVLINAFRDNSQFEKGLIYFVKYSLTQFITDNYMLFNIDFLKDIIPDSDKYFCNNSSFNYQLYINENILPYCEEIQYNILIYYLLPLIFQIDLTIYTNNNSKNLNKIIFKDESNQQNTNIDEDTNITLELIVYFGNTSILYNDDFYNKYKDSIKYISDYKYPLDKIQKISNNDGNKLLCDICNTIPEELIQVGPKIKPICSNCLKNYISKVIDKKYSLLKDDYYFHEEYYCSKIKLTNALENNLCLSLNDIKIILPNHNNISEEIHSKILKNISCDKCNVKFIDKKYCICFDPCGHLICNDCFISYINNITHNRIILNKYELNTELIEYKCLYCSNQIQNLNKFIYNYFEDIDIYIKKADERLITQTKTLCCVCHNVTRKYLFNVSMNSNNDNNETNIQHCLCTKCKNNLDSQYKNNKKRSHQTKLLCVFCGDYHIYNPKNLEIKEDKNESCCIIY